MKKRRYIQLTRYTTGQTRCHSSAIRASRSEAMWAASVGGAVEGAKEEEDAAGGDASSLVGGDALSLAMKEPKVDLRVSASLEVLTLELFFFLVPALELKALGVAWT